MEWEPKECSHAEAVLVLWCNGSATELECRLGDSGNSGNTVAAWRRSFEAFEPINHQSNQLLQSTLPCS